MEYQVLARKWRPRTFESLVGQEHVVRALTHALVEKRLHHAYLFTGTRGVGKTTLARILAKSMNCETGITATPCGKCDSCIEIDSGRFVDLLEVDAATNTKVDEMRQLLENAVYAPTRGRFKVYVIDEVHMLSSSSFNAMLKTLEEPPEHIKFILATTDPQKIPITVLSRCMQLNLRQMSPLLISTHLQTVLAAEAISAELPALNLLAHAASGSMRDALSLLDQAIAHGAGKVCETDVRSMLGSVDKGYLFSILEALLEDDAPKMLAVADDMALRSLSFDEALLEFASLITRVQVAQLAPAAIADESPDRERLLDLAQRLDPEYIQLAYQILVHGRKELPLAPDELAGFTMCLLRLYAFAPKEANEIGSETAKEVKSDAPKRAPLISRPVNEAKVAPLSPEPALQAPETDVPQAIPPWEDLPEENTLPQESSESLGSPESSESSESLELAANTEIIAAIPVDNSPEIDAEHTLENVPKAALGATSLKSPPENSVSEPIVWPLLLEALKLNGMELQLAQHCEFVGFADGKIRLRLPPSQKHLQRKPTQDRLRQTLCEHFGEELLLTIELDEVSGETPAAIKTQKKTVKKETALNAIKDDEFVRQAAAVLGATFSTESVKPI